MNSEFRINGNAPTPLDRDQRHKRCFRRANSALSIRRRQAARSFTIIEMLVVLAIIGLVTTMTLPMLIPFMRGRKLDQAAEMVKTACLMARSKAVQQRRKFCVTLLEVAGAVVITDYEELRDHEELPGKPAGDDQIPFCPHDLYNYGGANDRERADNRFNILESVTAERILYLPEGCRFDFSDASTDYPGWTYIFLPSGGAWTLQPDAYNARNNSYWAETTLMDSGRSPTGVCINGPANPDGAESVTVIVYATTGQARSD